MKIALITTYDFASPGGVRNHIYHLAKELKRSNHEVTIFAPSSENNATQSFDNFISIGKFPITSKLFRIPPHLLISPIIIFRLKKILNEANFDIIHIHEPLLPPLCLSVLFHKNTPLVATFHTYYERGQPFYRLFRPLFTRWLRNLKGRIAVSIPARKYIEQYFPYDYEVIPNGVDVNLFALPSEKKVNLSPGYFDLLFVGHAQFKRKGLRYLLQAFLQLKEKYPMLRLLIVGANWAGHTKPVELQDKNFKDVTYLGTVSEDELISLYHQAKIFCAPSLGNESFGIVLLEAMAAGIPIVATNIEGYARVLHHEQDALLVTPKDVNELVKAIERLIDNPDLREQLSQQGQLTVQHYSWEKVAGQIMDYYNAKCNIKSA